MFASWGTCLSSLSRPGFEDLRRQVYIRHEYAVPNSIDFRSYLADPNTADIIDETLDLFRANSLFRNFEIKGPADRILIVLILYVSDCLAKLGSQKSIPSQLEANKLLNTLSVDNFPIPGDATFPLNAHYAPPGSRADAGKKQ